MKRFFAAVLSVVIICLSASLSCFAAEETTIVDGIVYSADMKKLIECPDNYSGSAECRIPNGVEEICDGAFRDNKTVIEVQIPPSVKRIGADAFRNSNIVSFLVYPLQWTTDYMLETVEDRAFMDCRNLYSVKFHLPDFFDFGEDVFKNCTSLVMLDVPQVDVPESTFTGCSALKYVGVGQSEYATIMFRIGFMESNGKVTAAGAREILRLSAGISFKIANVHLAADVNRDGKISAADARITLRVAAKLQSF